MPIRSRMLLCTTALLQACAMMVFGHGRAFCETLNVPDDYATIQEAIEEAAGGDTVLVEAGTYEENIDFLGKSITVESADGPIDTIIDGGDLTLGPDYGSVAQFVSGESSDSVLSGFTLTGGSGTVLELSDGTEERVGGGICCLSSAPLLENLIIESNEAALGGGIYIGDGESGSTTVVLCEIRFNESSSIGGGMAISAADAAFLDCDISENTSGVLGGGGTVNEAEFVSFDGCTISDNTVEGEPIFLSGGNPAMFLLSNDVIRFENCEIARNSGGDRALMAFGNAETEFIACRFFDNDVTAATLSHVQEGNLFLSECLLSGSTGSAIEVQVVSSSGVEPFVTETTIDRSTIADNSGTGVYTLGSCADSDACSNTIIISNSIIWGNDDSVDIDGTVASSIRYTDIEGGEDGDGNIDEDPQFTGAYALAGDSPCIDAGDPRAPVDPDGSVPDLGAFPFLHFEFVRGDVDGDGAAFPLLDALALLAWGFLDGAPLPCDDAADTDDDGEIMAILDALFLLEWGFTNGEEPPTPGPDECGPDTTSDDLTCEGTGDGCD